MKLYDSLAYIFTKCIIDENIAEEWNTAYIAVYKKGNKLECNNNRGTSVTSTISRVYGIIIRDLVEHEYKIYEEVEQSDF